MTLNATATWRDLLDHLLVRGASTEQASAGAELRGRTSYEILGHVTRWPLDRAVVLCPARRLGYRFLAAEAAWIVSGSNRLDEIAPYARRLSGLSDDGAFLSGAYGPPFIEQLPYVCQTLARDRASRQAVATLWRQRPGAWRDVPCTLSLQWLLRGDPLTISCVANMRSSDAWLGVPYDIHAFAMMTALVALYLRDSLGPLRLGELVVSVGSQHLYHLDRETATVCAARDDERFDGLEPLHLDELAGPRDLVDHLWAVARRDVAGLRCGWLRETMG